MNGAQAMTLFRYALFGATALLAVTPVGCYGPSAGFPAGSSGSESLLQTAENPWLRGRDRADAVAELPAYKEKAVVIRLAELLKQHLADAIGYEAIVALEKIGDPDALPALRWVENRDYVKPGKLNAALKQAITSLEKKAR
jgi:hypothetical protein